MDRARELRVDISVLTTFYIGVLTNHDRVVARVETPHFEILFKASYGLDRDALEMVNDKIRHGRWRTKPYDKDDTFRRVRVVYRELKTVLMNTALDRLILDLSYATGVQTSFGAV